MTVSFMVLPATDHTAIRVVRVPPDFEQHEAYRHVTGLIASVEEDNPGYDWDDIESVLVEHGFETVDCMLGPALD